LRLVSAVTPVDPAADAGTSYPAAPSLEGAIGHALVSPEVPSPGSVFPPISAAGTYGGDADLAPPTLSLTKILWWLLVAAVTYAGATAVGMALGWVIESLLVWGFP
jgi:hypothetical protein